MPFFNFFIQTAILLITKTWWIWCWVESKAEIYFAGFVSAIYFLRSLINGIDLVQVSILKFFATRGSLHCLLFNDVFTYELISSRSHWEIWDQENINILNGIFFIVSFFKLDRRSLFTVKHNYKLCSDAYILFMATTYYNSNMCLYSPMSITTNRWCNVKNNCWQRSSPITYSTMCIL